MSPELINKEQQLIKLGFKKVYLSDKSGFWWEKSIKILDFKVQFTFDTNYNQGDITINYKKQWIDLKEKVKFNNLIKILKNYEIYSKK